MIGSSKPLLLVIALSTVLVLPSLFDLPAKAQRRDWWVPIQEAIANINPFRKKPQPKLITVSPGDNRSGGPRDLCPITPYPLTSFVLPTDEPGATYVEPVSSDRPTFWFYVPYAEANPGSTSRRLEFVLLDRNEQIIYEQRFFLPKTAGVVSVSLPQTAPTLQVEQQYRWVASVICNPLNRAGDATVNGWIKRVSLPLEIDHRLSQAVDVRDKVVLYAEQQFWYETVSMIANPIQPVSMSPSDLQIVKNTLLKEVGLPENTPFLGAAMPEPPGAFRTTH